MVMLSGGLEQEKSLSVHAEMGNEQAPLLFISVKAEG